jgi:hypothetical protein
VISDRAKRSVVIGSAAVAAIFGPATLKAADPATEQRLKQLEQQNESLQKTLLQQKALIDDLAKKLSDVTGKAPETAPDDGAKKRGYELGKIRISGEGGVGVFHSNSEGRYQNTDFRVDEAKLFIEAPLWENYVFAFAELDLLTRERQAAPSGGYPIDDTFHLGEIYVDFESVSRLWNQPGMLSIRAGRMDIPFGEEYLARDVIDNPLISHSLTDLWGVDEGIELYGAVGKVDYVFAVQNGGHPMLAEYDSDKALTARIGVNPTSWLRVSGSALRTGELTVSGDKMSELWFGNGFIRGPFFGATKFKAAVFEGDVQARWKTGHVKTAGGWINYSDNAPDAMNTDRDTYYYYVEVVQRLPDMPKLYGALRVSQIFADNGVPIVGLGDFGTYFYTPSLATDRMSRISAGLGYKFSDQLSLKVEYTWEDRHVVAPDSETTHFFGAEVGFAF